MPFQIQTAQAIVSNCVCIPLLLRRCAVSALDEKLFGPFQLAKISIRNTKFMKDSRNYPGCAAFRFCNPSCFRGRFDRFSRAPLFRKDMTETHVGLRPKNRSDAPLF